MKKEQDIIRTIIFGGFIIQLILLIIKLTSLVNWSWYIILIPIEIYFGLGVISCIVLSLIILIEE